MSSPGAASTQLQGSPGPTKSSFQGSPGPTRGSFSSLQRPVIPSPPHTSTGILPSSTASPRRSPAQDPRTNLPGIDTSSHDNLRTPGRTDSFPSSGAWSTVATPGVADDDGKEKRFDLNRPSPPSPSAPPLDPAQEPRSPGDKKNVRFAGPDGAPLSPAHTHMTFDSYDAPTAPPPSNAYSPTEPSASTGNAASNGASSSSDPAGQTRGNSSSSSSRTNTNGNGNGNGFNQTPHSGVLPPPPPPSLASAPKIPPPVAQPHGLGLSSPLPSAQPVPISAVPSAPPTRKQIEQTQKHAKWAISALEFDDVETARAELRKAMAMIGA